jgi:ethanolamine permease
VRAVSEFIFYLTVGAGMALGTSAFTMVGGLFEVVPLGWVLLAIVLAGLFCGAIALSIGELASMWPSAPAIRTYFKMAFGERVSLILVYIYLVFIVLIAGVESYMFALVVHAMLPAVSPIVTVLVLLASVIAANMYGLDLPRFMQILTTVGCIAIVLGMGAAGLLMTPLGGLELALFASGGGVTALPAAIGIAIFLFIGFEWITPVGLRPAAYARQIPQSMLWAIVTLTATYLAFAVGLGVSLPRGRIASESIPQVPYFIAVLGPKGVWLAGALSFTAIFSTFNAGLMGGARLLQAMAREGTLPAWIAFINPNTGAPIGAVVPLGGTALGSSMVIVTFELQLLAAVIGAAIVCFIYSAYMFSVLRLRRIQATLGRPFRTPLPDVLQWAVCLVLPFIGLATLFSLPEWGSAPAVGLLVCSVLAVVAAEWSSRRLLVAACGRTTPRPAVTSSQ